MRGALAASAATFLALMSHVIAGGTVPGVLGLVVPWMLSVAVCTVLAGRALSLVRLSIAIAASQALFHTLFVLGVVATGGASESNGHVHGAATQMTPIAVEASASLAHSGATMWLGHSLAALATIAVVYRGERAARRIAALAGEAVRWARRRIVRVTLIRVPALTPLAWVADAPRPVAPLGWHPSAVGRRGPPALLAI